MVKRMQTALNIAKRTPRVSVPARHPTRWAVAAALATLVPVALATAVWAAAAAVLVRVVASDMRAPKTGPRAPEDLLTAAAAVLALTLLGWLALGVLLEIAALAPGRIGAVASRTAARITPGATRRMVGFVLGMGLAAVAAPPALAVGRDPGPASRVAGAQAPVGIAPGSAGPAGVGRAPEPGWAPAAPAPGWTPTAPVVRPLPSTDLLTRPPRTVATDDAVVVHRGDTLWSIAARRLGAGASDAEIAAEWPRWHAANRHVIGADPDLILPGQRLRAPAARRAP